MICEYDLTNADVSAAQQALAPPPPPAQTMKFSRGLIGWVLFVAMAVMLFTLLNKNRNRELPRAVAEDAPAEKRWMFQTGIALSISGVVLFVGLWVFLALLRRSHRPLKDGRVTVRFDDTAVTVTSAHRQDTLAWPAVLDVVETDRHFILPNTGPYALILPKRGFATAGEVEDLRNLLADRVVRTAQRAPA